MGFFPTIWEYRRPFSCIIVCNLPRDVPTVESTEQHIIIAKDIESSSMCTCVYSLLVISMLLRKSTRVTE